ncbi:MAG TPA: L,D-transpeptidase [Pseudolabrys sp.]|nr:L,D-transpeptidase [Pseudolabrys sp.]
MSKSVSIAALAAAAALSCGIAKADPLFDFLTPPVRTQIAPQVQAVEPAPSEDSENAQLPPRLQRQVVAYAGTETPGTIIIDTPHTFLYYVVGGGKAIRYGIGVGRKGFTWSGVKAVVRKAEWPDWYPPPEMIARQPYLPRMVAGGPGNPLGARAMYIGGTEYRIHGTNDPSTIGKFVSSGCIRMTNDNVTDLYKRVQVGAKVVVLPQTYVADSSARARPVPVTQSYAPQAPSPAQATWTRIRPSGLY